MGTYGGYHSRQELVAEVTRNFETEFVRYEYIAKKFSGNDLWTVLEVTQKETGEKQRVIYLFKISRWGGDWAYKPIEESMGPCQHSCPLAFLEMVPEPERPEHYHDWRAGVREYWARRNQKLSTGSIVRLTNNREYKIARTDKNKIFGTDILSGEYVRIPRGMLTLDVR
jgi:hypothetical protein